MTFYDYLVIGFYLVFMLALGPVYKGFSKTASDFFRGGGGMLWWVVGASTFMTTFSAWSFTGGAAKAYETGTFFLLLFLCNFVGLFFTYFVTAARFRQMRIITAIEGVHKRYGPVNEQVFTWLPILFRILFGGISLYAIAVFMFGVFQIDMRIIIVALGITAIVMTLVGGSWAATAGDFVQMLIVLSVTALMALLCIWHPDVGGPGQLVDKLPSRHFDWTEFDRPWVILVFAITLMANQVMQNNSMLDGAAKYVFVKDGRDAKKAVLVSIVGFFFLSPIWLIPAVTATIVLPDLAGRYPELNNPNEAAYVAMAIEMLPTGLLGLMVCAIFAASMTSLNSGLNVVSGTFVRNFYIKVIDARASEAKQISIGRICTLVYGILWILVALTLVNLPGLKLFDLILICAASIGLPTAVPLLFGMFVKRTPPWSGWSTMVIGFVLALGLHFTLSESLITTVFNPVAPFTGQELDDLNIALTTGVIATACTAWFFFTRLFYREQGTPYERQVDAFFEEMGTPVDTTFEHGPAYDNDARQYNVLGTLCLTYGAFVLLLILIPNTATDRLLILLVGGVIALSGLILRAIAKRLRAKILAGERAPV